MKAYGYLFFLLVATTVDLSAQTNVSWRINHLLGSEAFVFGQTFPVDGTTDIEVARLEYYISDISLVHDGGQTSAVGQTFLIDAGQPQDLALGSYTFDQLEAIRFSIGVHPDENHLDPTAFPTDHPLYPQSPSMHWGWQAGYRFIAYEGTVNGNVGFELHALGDENYFGQTVAIDQVLEEDGGVVVELYADYLAGLHDIKLGLGPISHGATDEAQDCIINFAERVFSSAPPAGNPVSISQPDLERVASIFPVPAVDGRTAISLRARGPFVLQIFDSSGKEVRRETIETSRHEVYFEQSGTYLLQLIDESGQRYARRVIVP